VVQTLPQKLKTIWPPKTQKAQNKLIFQKFI